MIRNIRHIQVKKVAYHPNLFKAILTFERPNIEYDESDEIEYIKYLEHQKDDCPKCEKVLRERWGSIEKYEEFST
tara:strand:+ start:145 stop:369 length:225 start_codon:yes stop_codon:yes gene_type:complete